MKRKDFLKKITCISESNCIEVMPMKKVDFNNFQLPNVIFAQVNISPKTCKIKIHRDNQWCHYYSLILHLLIVGD